MDYMVGSLRKFKNRDYVLRIRIKYTVGKFRIDYTVCRIRIDYTVL